MVLQAVCKKVTPVLLGCFIDNIIFEISIGNLQKSSFSFLISIALSKGELFVSLLKRIFDIENVIDNNKLEQAGAELCQAQTSLS